jgi:hypothetical protein
VETPSPSYRACEAGFSVETEANGGHEGDWTRPISGSSSRARGAARVSNRSVRSVMGRARPVKP